MHLHSIQSTVALGGGVTEMKYSTNFLLYNLTSHVWIYFLHLVMPTEACVFGMRDRHGVITNGWEGGGEAMEFPKTQ